MGRLFQAYHSSGSRPSIFYPAPRAKYDAWVATHAKYTASSSSTGAETAKASAQERYLEIARQVGWTNEGLGDDDEEIDFDASDEEPAQAESSGSSVKPRGMGPRVSVMAQDNGTDASEGQEEVSALHVAVVDDSADDVRRILAAEPRGVNEKDEFVSDVRGR